MALIFYIFFTLGTCFSAVADDIFLYRNAENSGQLDLETSRRIFDGSKLSWENGKDIVLLVKELNVIDESSFLSFSNLSKSQFLNRWRIKFFSGRALIPIQVKSVSSVFETLKANPSGIFFSFQELSDDDLGTEKKNLKIDKISF